MTIATNILPTVDFCGTELTRLMIGGNHQSRLLAL
ncbi:MAG: hypothetical protein ACI906_003371 [Candidatus Latescibacterota bacterium]|jgi:hypothetical protein